MNAMSEGEVSPTGLGLNSWGLPKWWGDSGWSRILWNMGLHRWRQATDQIWASTLLPDLPGCEQTVPQAPAAADRTSLALLSAVGCAREALSFLKRLLSGTLPQQCKDMGLINIVIKQLPLGSLSYSKELLNPKRELQKPAI